MRQALLTTFSTLQFIEVQRIAYVAFALLYLETKSLEHVKDTDTYSQHLTIVSVVFRVTSLKK